MQLLSTDIDKIGHILSQFSIQIYSIWHYNDSRSEGMRPDVDLLLDTFGRSHESQYTRLFLSKFITTGTPQIARGYGISCEF